MKAKRSFFNLTTGLFSQIILILSSMIVTKLILDTFGSEVNGFIASVTQIMVYLTLLEAGVGAASLQALYKPVAENRIVRINQIMSATSVFYKKTGLIYLVAIIVIALIYAFFVDTQIDKLTIILVIILTGIGSASGALNYLYIAKYKILLMAEGKSYIDTTLLTIINILISLSKIALILTGFNVIVVQTTHLIFIIVQIVLFKYYIKKNYSWLSTSTSPDFKSIDQRNSALIHQISYLVFSNTDMIILTIFVDLKTVSVYVIYNMVFSTIDRFIQQINKSFSFILGQTFSVDIEKFYKLNKTYETYFMAFIFSITTVIYILTLPFISLYTQNVDDVDYTLYLLPILFTMIKLLTNARITSNNIINIAGHFKSTQLQSITETLINLSVSLILVNFIGIYGVLLGTIVALLYRSIDIIVYAQRKILNKSPFATFKKWLTYIIIFIVILLVSNSYTISSDSYLQLAVFSIFIFIIVLPLYLITGSLVDRDSYHTARNIIIGLINERRKNRRNV